MVDLRPPGSGGAGGEEVDQLLGRQGLVVVLVVLLEQLLEKVVAVHRELDSSSRRNRDWSHQLLGLERQVVSIAEPRE